MTRKEKRQLNKESNAFRELLKVIKHFSKNFFEELGDVKDPRHQSYTIYNTAELLFVALLAHTMTIGSMRSMTELFNKDECIENIKLKNYKIGELPHYDTINNFLEQLAPEKLSRIRTYMIRELLKKRCFEQHRILNKYWLIAVDATGIHSFHKRHCEYCLKRVQRDEKTDEEKIVYYHNVLEAKLIVGDFVFSIATEFIENENGKVSKQNCEKESVLSVGKTAKAGFQKITNMYCC